MQRQLALLRRLGAPNELVDSFIEACSVNDSQPEQRRDSFPDLLEEVCRRHGFQDVLQDGWFFRPAKLGGQYYRADAPPQRDDLEAATIEQAYRRGFSHGFADCAQLVRNDIDDAIAEREKAISEWRFRNDVLDNEWFFPPAILGGQQYRADSPPGPDDPEAATIEQAYRRGFSQGFADCAKLVRNDGSGAIAKREKAINEWRFRRIQQYRSLPGTDELPGLYLFSGRTTISVRVRWEILKRDGNRCVVCGQGASDGVSLEIDHIVPVSKGGSDEKSNLQVLCAPCNRGKSNRP
jgi:hypothetical protein